MRYANDWSRGWARQTAAGPSQWGEWVTDLGVRVRCYRGARNRVRFYDAQGRQVGAEQANVAPAFAAALSAGWRDAASLAGRAILARFGVAA